jgi:hypothetical protein
MMNHPMVDRHGSWALLSNFDQDCDFLYADVPVHDPAWERALSAAPLRLVGNGRQRSGSDRNVKETAAVAEAVPSVPLSGQYLL